MKAASPTLSVRDSTEALCHWKRIYIYLCFTGKQRYYSNTTTIIHWYQLIYSDSTFDIVRSLSKRVVQEIVIEDYYAVGPIVAQISDSRERGEFFTVATSSSSLMSHPVIVMIIDVCRVTYVCARGVRACCMFSEGDGMKDE